MIREILELERLTKKIPNYNPGIKFGDQLVLEMVAGLGQSRGLLNRPEIAVAVTVLSTGSKLGMHNHPEREFIIVFRGQMTLHCFDSENKQNTIVLTTGDQAIVEPHIKHCATVEEECHFIAITIPASKNFPNDIKAQ